MNFFLQIIIFLSLSISLHSLEPKNLALETDFALHTIPKSGSHLMIKTLYYLTGLSPEWHVDAPSVKQLKLEKKFPYTHLCLSPALSEFYSQSPQIKKIVMIRDLRDVCVSIVHQILKGPWPEFTGNPAKSKAFKKLSFDDQLLFVIQQQYELDASKNIDKQLAIAQVSAQAAKMVQENTLLVCRFENLVGERGGGSKEAQKKEIKKVADYLDITLSDSELEQVAQGIYGDENNPFGSEAFAGYSSTFREGKIGGWKEHFKEVHKIAFKKRMGAALIALGYEENENW